MENKKLIKILLKDMGELEELIADVKKNKQFDAIEMEFIHTRAKGLLQLLQLFESKDDFQKNIPPIDKEKVEEIKEKVDAAVEKTEEIKEEKAEPVSSKTEDISEKEEEVEEEKPDENETDEALQVPPAEEMVAEAAEKAEEKEPIHESDSAEISEEQVEAKNDDEMLGEEEDKSEANSRLGDSFLKGKSVNDLITDQHKLEYKLSNRPVTSIQAAIGINDRFQYIRELFDGDNEKFLETVKTLDTMNDIKEAVDYLRNNFKWKKNETSLKFVNLVKRRFQNG
jgi:hypothetical protein